MTTRVSTACVLMALGSVACSVDGGETSMTTFNAPTPGTGTDTIGNEETGSESSGEGSSESGASESGSESGGESSGTGTGTESGSESGSESGTETGDPERSCEDDEQNQDETDVDCGGEICGACAVDSACEDDDDCTTQSCIDQLCTVPGCADGVQNQDESDIDCGGICDPCSEGQSCVDGNDCDEGVCTDLLCAPADCEDGVQNQDETDIDCGGLSCDPCVDGFSCVENEDCESGYCANNNVCSPKDCEFDSDCDTLDDDCTEGACNLQDFTCEATAANQGDPCDDEDLCTGAGTCDQGSCTAGAPNDCTQLDDQCNLGACDPDDGSCFAQPANEGLDCDDANGCTLDDVCQAGSCVSPDGPAIHFEEDFSDNGANWDLGDTWEIGAAVGSAAGEVGSGDPDTDHSPSGDDGIAGALIGGVTDGSQAWTYITSPNVNLSGTPLPLTLRLYRWLNADTFTRMPSTIEINDGGGWELLWQNPEAVSDESSWTEMDFDVSANQSPLFRVRVGYRRQGNASSAAGWNLDDVTIAHPACLP